ncbi:MAG TPA: GNAT family N-acetyltransferase [Geminicoccaceae bacterium]|nr:GNAT family N-acetyltransferase [Geminicoccaceae bacterium]
MAATVREAAVDDAAAVVRLVHRFERENGRSDAKLTAADLLADGFGKRPRFRVLLAEDAGRALGYALFYPSYDTEHAARGLYLQDLYVVPDARRSGVGRALMAAVARACEADGGCYLFWNAHDANHAGRAFYRRIGAREERVVTLSLQPDALRRLAAKG